MMYREGIFFLFAAVCLAQFCAEYNGETPACNQLIPSGGLFYVPTGKTAEEVHTTVQGLAALNSLIPSGFADCKNSSLIATCVGEYRSCFVDRATNTSYPVPLCSTLCEAVNSGCSDLFALTNRQPENCTTTPDPDFPVYPKYGSVGSNNEPLNFTRTIFGVDVELSCSNVFVVQSNETLTFSNETEVTCAFPLAKNSKGECYCCGCPDNAFTDTQYNVLFGIYWFIGALVTAMLLLSTITFCLVPKKKKAKYPWNIPFVYYSISMIGFTATSLISAVFSIQGTFCNEGDDFIEPATQSNNWICAVQGVILIYFTYCTFLWIIALVSNFIYYYNKLKIMPHTRWWHSIWVFSLLPAAASLISFDENGGGGIGYVRSSHTCFIRVNENVANTETSWLRVGLIFYFPISFLYIFMLGELILLTYLIYVTKKKVASKSKKGQSHRHEYKTMILVLSFLFHFLVVAGTFYYGIIAESSIQQAYTDWTECYARNPTGLNSVTGEECKLKGGFPFGLFVFNAFQSTLVGFTGFFIFGFYDHIWKYWMPRLGLAKYVNTMPTYSTGNSSGLVTKNASQLNTPNHDSSPPTSTPLRDNLPEPESSEVKTESSSEQVDNVKTNNVEMDMYTDGSSSSSLIDS